MKKYDIVIEKILFAVNAEHDEHESCGFDFGCVLTSKTLKDRLKVIMKKFRLELRDAMIDELSNSLNTMVNKGEFQKLVQDKITNFALSDELEGYKWTVVLQKYEKRI